jgi:hypothetical protein
MDSNEIDDEVINLLTHLKSAESAYPADMMALRRQAYQSQIAALGIGMGAAGALGQTLKSGGRGFTLPPIAGTIIESILIVAIVAESAAAAYVNRDKIIDLFRTISQQSTGEEIEEVGDLSVESVVPTVELVLTSTAQLTETATPVGTPSPELLLAPDVTADSGGNSEQIIATLRVTDNNGNQYGLTPKPGRTKDPGNGDDTNGDDKEKNPKKKP